MSGSLRFIAALLLVGLAGCGEKPAPRKLDLSGLPDTYDSFVVMGVGQNDCGKLTEDLKTDDGASVLGARTRLTNVYAHYITGFFTGRNFQASQNRQGNPNIGKDTSPEALFSALERYCDEHPLDKVFVALADVYRQLEMQ